MTHYSSISIVRPVYDHPAISHPQLSFVHATTVGGSPVDRWQIDDRRLAGNILGMDSGMVRQRIAGMLTAEARSGALRERVAYRLNWRPSVAPP